MGLLVEKLVLLLFLFILGFGAGLGPYLLRNRFLAASGFRDRLVSFLNCVSAGVFFSTFFMHMLPEAQEEFEIAFGSEIEYPFAGLFVSLGFFFVMFIEQIVLTFYGDNDGHQHSKTIKNPHTEEDLDSPERLSLTQATPNYQAMEDGKQESNGRNRTGSVETEVIASGDEIDVKIVEDTSEHSHGHGNLTSHTSVRAIILLFALSTHALFEGLAIGLQSSTNALRTLVIAVIIHKMALAFSYGISLVSNKATLKSVLTALTIFSIMAPIGIAIGAALSYAKNKDDVTDKIVAVVQGFASGTFVYVIFIEIIPHEFTNGATDRRLLKTMFMAIGFSVMAGLQALPHEEE